MNTPWWGAALIGGLFALGGVLATQATTIVLERLRRNRENATRWHTDRRQLYASFIVEARSIHSLIYDHWGDDSKWNSFDNRIQDLDLKTQEIMLLATRPVRESAGDVAGYLSILPSTVKGGATRESTIEELDKLGTRLVEAIRGELGVRDS
jgi:hypothetical protein